MWSCSGYRQSRNLKFPNLAFLFLSSLPPPAVLGTEARALFIMFYHWALPLDSAFLFLLIGTYNAHTIRLRNHRLIGHLTSKLQSQVLLKFWKGSGYVSWGPEPGNSPRTGAPSMISYLAIVSFSWYTLGPVPVVSRLMISISMCLILILTSRKYIFPTMTSFKWYLRKRK